MHHFQSNLDRFCVGHVVQVYVEGTLQNAPSSDSVTERPPALADAQYHSSPDHVKTALKYEIAYTDHLHVQELVAAKQQYQHAEKLFVIQTLKQKYNPNTAKASL